MRNRFFYNDNIAEILNHDAIRHMMLQVGPAIFGVTAALTSVNIAVGDVVPLWKLGTLLVSGLAFSIGSYMSIEEAELSQEEISARLQDYNSLL